ncbi:hypothetical protein KUTeg_011343 [Tegillarca granosa]|uniref:SET domain-containing protein n=1 Tax=Tegillarca granosa TaxID=220873 RepID=A0ABQ9F122_TEGGR|nr:hypothetical protein KUTeg_011343 [Tegillarca granosa]
MFVCTREISKHEELRYDYGNENKNMPWRNMQKHLHLHLPLNQSMTHREECEKMNNNKLKKTCQWINHRKSFVQKGLFLNLFPTHRQN